MNKIGWKTAFPCLREVFRVTRKPFTNLYVEVTIQVHHEIECPLTLQKYFLEKSTR